MRLWIPLCAGLIALLAGCFDQAALLKKLIPETEDRFARDFIEAVRTGDLTKAQKMLDGSVEESAARKGLEELRGMFTQSALVEVETIGFQLNLHAGTSDQPSRVAQLSYQLKLEKHWLAGTVVLVGEGAALKVNTARFNPLPDSLGTLNAFSFGGKSWLHYAAFLALVLVPVFCIAVLVLCIRARPRRRWLWLIFILLPLTTFRLNWTTGAWEFSLLSFNLLGAGFMKSGLYAPWVLSVGFPIGAIIFLAKRKSLLAANASAPVPPAAPPQ